jgi:hypothetical protein
VFVNLFSQLVVVLHNLNNNMAIAPFTRICRWRALPEAVMQRFLRVLWKQLGIISRIAEGACTALRRARCTSSV